MDLQKLKQDAIAITMQAGHVPYIEGDPGCGKTAFIEALARRFDAELLIEIGSIADPLDFKGQPIIIDDARFPGGKRVMFQVSEQWVRVNDAPRGIVFLDELPNSAGPIQAALLTIIQKRILGTFKLGPHVMFAAAGNKIEHCPNGTPLFAPMANRMVHFKWDFSVDNWRNGMLAGWPEPNVPILPTRRPGETDGTDWRDYRTKAVALVTGFSNHRASAICDMPKGENEQAGAWPSPRSWDMLTDVLAAAFSVGANLDVQRLLASGCVGDGAGQEFISWVDKLDLQDPEELLKAPKSLDLKNKRGDLQYATLGSVAGAVIAKMTPARYKAGWLVMVEAQKQKAGDVACSAVMAMAKNRKPGCNVPNEAAVFFPMLRSAGLLESMQA